MRETRNAWEYYVNQVHEMDKFVGDQLIEAVESRNEPSVIVFYGDHLPTMNLEAKDLKEPLSLQYKLCDLGQYRTGERSMKTSPHTRSWRRCLTVWISIPVRCSTTTSSESETKNYLADLELLQYDIMYGDTVCL